MILCVIRITPLIMSKIRYIYLATGLLLLLTACSKESRQPSPDVVDEERLVEAVRFELPTIPYVEDAPDTRVAFSRDGSEFNLAFETTDTLGICPAEGSPIYFKTTGGRSASFDGGAWRLRMNVDYYSYFPFIPSFYLDKTRVPVRFDGQRQRGLEYPLPNTSAFFSCIGEPDNVNDLVTFNYKLANCYINVNATLPAGTYTKMHLRLEEDLFVQTGTVDITQEPPVITPGRMTHLLTLDLQDATLVSEGLLAAYVSCAPIDITGKVITIYFLDNEGFVYKAQKTVARAYEAGIRYGLTCTPVLDDGYSFGISGWTQDPVYEGVAE